MELYSEIRKDLKEGRWGLEGQLPSFRSLAKHYNCSLTVVQQAFRALDDEGLIRSCRGKGTFWADAQLKPNFRRNKIIGITYLEGCFKQELEEIKHSWLNDGWFIAGYNADQHLQDPAMERRFVQQAQREHFTGVVLLATPLQPTNRYLFASMRLEGMKIAHLMPYQDDMTQEAYFCVDHLAAGRLAVAEAARAGYRNIVYWCEGDSPDRRLNQQGLREMASSLGLEMLPDMDRNRTWVQQDVAKFLAGESCEEPPFLPELLALPEETCICSQSPVLLHQARLLLERFGKNDRRIGQLAMDDFNGADQPVSTVVFDHKAQLEAAFTYIADSKWEANNLIQKLFPPRFVNRGTL